MFLKSVGLNVLITCCQIGISNYTTFSPALRQFCSWPFQWACSCVFPKNEGCWTFAMRSSPFLDLTGYRHCQMPFRKNAVLAGIKDLACPPCSVPFFLFVFPEGNQWSVVSMLFPWMCFKFSLAFVCIQNSIKQCHVCFEASPKCSALYLHSCNLLPHSPFLRFTRVATCRPSLFYPSQGSLTRRFYLYPYRLVFWCAACASLLVDLCAHTSGAST